MSEPADAEAAGAAPASPPAAPPESPPAPGRVAADFPDDGPVARVVRRVDAALGQLEQAVVFGLLALVVVVAALAALHDRLSRDHLGRWWHYIVRGGTFATAMFAAVYATQQQRHLAMDLVSRRLSARGRLVLGVALRVLTIGVTGLLFWSGLRQREVAGGSEHLSVLGFHLNDADIVSTISIGAALIALHAALHIAIDVDYLVRGKLPPERARTGH